MSTTLTAASLPAAAPARLSAPTAPRAPDGARSLSLLLLAAVVATLVTVADRVIDTWADGHLLLAWVLLWAVVFGGLALFANTARRLARRGMAALDGWSRSMAEARAEMRLWEMAKQDPRLMSELMAARTRATPEAEAAPMDANKAIAPVGMSQAAASPEASPLGYWDRLAQRRASQSQLNYI